MRTSLYSILCICIRLAAILLAISVLAAIPGTYVSLPGGDWAVERWWIVLVYAGLFVLALLFWVFPGFLARLAAGKTAMEVFESPITAETIQYVAFSVVGLRYLIGGTYSLMYLLPREMMVRHALRAQSTADAVTFHDADFTATIISYSFEVVVGLGLLLGARGLVGLLDRLRETSLPPAVSDTTDVLEEGEKS
jgi:hypothetical protein